MPVIPQSLDKVFFTQLKGLHNVEISFTDNPITAIFGVNGCGKSTIVSLICKDLTYRIILKHSFAIQGKQLLKFFKKLNISIPCYDILI